MFEEGNKFGKGNENSGRKSSYEEHNKTQAINKLWEKVNEKVQAGKELSEYEQKLVLQLLPKTIKTEMGVSGDLFNLVIKRDNNGNAGNNLTQVSG